MQLPGPMVWGEPSDPDHARAVLRRVIDLGIDFIDTAWFYGPRVSNRLIAETLHPYPKSLVIATKLGGRRTEDKGWAGFARPEELRQGHDEDLRGLKLEQTHVTHLRFNSHAGVPFAESLDTMIELKKEGKIRHLGLSNVSRAQLDLALAKTPIVCVQNLYNVAFGEKTLGPSPIAETQGQEDMVDFCAEKGIAYLPFFPLAIPGSARETPRVLGRIADAHRCTIAQVALAWLLARSKTMLPIPGTSSVAHLNENWDARALALTPEEYAAIRDAR
jgi:aryl-alcohol dehydrogenase-like predicted oxidoreductase